MANSPIPSELTLEERKELLEDQEYIQNIIDRYNLKQEDGSYLTEFYTLALILKDSY